MVNENLEQKSNSLKNKEKERNTVSDDLGAVLVASEGGNDTGGSDVENYEENLGILTDQYISDIKVGDIFLKFCEVGCGRAVEYSVDIKSFMTCLNNFQKEHPEYAQYIKIDERYL